MVEAMKMETEIKSPMDGTVSAVLVEKGDSISPREVLVEIAPASG